MHELSIATAVRDAAERHAAGRRVLTVRLRVGALRQVVPSALAFAWQAVAAQGGPCEGAVLEQERVPARLRCDGCRYEWQPDEPSFACPLCGGATRVIEGDELLVESIDVEDEEDRRCIA